jgi:hypothetical protein
LPRNCSLGTKYFCIGSVDHIDCRELPLNISNIVPGLVIEQLGDIGKLNQALTYITPGGVRDCLIVSAVFAAFAFLLGISSTQQQYTHDMISRVWENTRSLCCTICISPLLAWTVILYGLRSRAHLPKEVSLETGRASQLILAALICAISMQVLSIAKRYERHMPTSKNSYPSENIDTHRFDTQVLSVEDSFPPRE